MVFTLAVHHVGTICKNLSLFFYLTKQHFCELIVCYRHFNTFNNYFVEHIRGDIRGVCVCVCGGGGVTR